VNTSKASRPDFTSYYAVSAPALAIDLERLTYGDQLMTTLTPTSARLVCSQAVSLVTGLIESLDWTAPGMWEVARKSEAADDRKFYRGGSIKARTAPERDATLVLAMMEPYTYTMTSLYGVRDAFVKAVLIGHVHADKLRALPIDLAELRAAVEVLGDARRG
jgi:hypothetical protein